MHIRLDGYMYYPTGLHIHRNLIAINQMASQLTSEFGREAEIALWCRGSSGAIIAAIVSMSFPNSVINHVKKDGENSHSSNIYSMRPINVIVDDFCDSCATVNAIATAMSWDGATVDCIAVFGSVETNRIDFNYTDIMCEVLISQI